MLTQGYYRRPAIHGDAVYFVTEDDVWCVSASGGLARRLTAGLGLMGNMAVSPDGQWLAVTAREEKHSEVYITLAEGGPLKRLTYLGAECSVRGFTPEGEILFTSNAAQPFQRLFVLYRIGRDGGQPQQYPWGAVQDLSFGPQGRKVLGRSTADPAYWKRYRGGLAGKLWIDNDGNGQFRPLLPDLNGNLASPMWIGNRIFFLSDHEGVGNLYSCDTDGVNLRRHTDHEEYFARSANTDGNRIVYHCGADIYCFEPASGRQRKVEIEWHGPATQTQRRFIDTVKFLDDFSVHPDGDSLAVDCRGKPFTFGLWEDAVKQHGILDGVRYRFPQWLNDGKTLVAVSDATGEERIDVLEEDGTGRSLEHLDLGRVVTMAASPTAAQVAVTNHRLELLLVDINAGTLKHLDSAAYRRIEQVAWSPDGAWLAYDFTTSRNTAAGNSTQQTSAIKLCEVATGRAFLATTPEFRDFAPAFDPGGKYLYFLSHRVLDPVYDNVYFDLNFPRSVKPCLVILSKEEPSPFVPKPHCFVEKDDSNAKRDEPPPVRVDAEGIERRILSLPVPEGIYQQIGGLHGKVLFTSFPVRGSLNTDWVFDKPKGGDLHCFDLQTQEYETVLNDVVSFATSKDATALVYRTPNRLRAVNATAKIEKAQDDKPSRKTGWIDLSRVKVSVDPRAEWMQMFRDVWRLQREYFWVEDMSGVNWQRVYERYAPFVQRVSTRAEFSDLVWEMQGELGTSHAYEMGGDHRLPPEWPLGLLAADFSYDSGGFYRIAHIVKGDTWNPDHSSPLDAPGLGIHEGDRLLAVRGQRLGAHDMPQAQLVHQAGVPVDLTVAGADGTNVRRVTVTTLKNETPARYREWVDGKRQFVHHRTGGRCGYIHLPDMSARGYSEFHRYFSLEAERESLIIDVRYNGGGHVSSLILEKLGRRRIGYDFPRWSIPVPYPPESVLGPMIAICNEFTGSDGDVFSHAFKMMKLGPLVGKRTWGGVIGIWPQYRLVDGSVTTQPEYSFWFKDVEWGIENYGAKPDVEVDIAPQDYASGKDRQLEKAIELVFRALEENPPQVPKITNRPSLPLPQLPRRAAKD